MTFLKLSLITSSVAIGGTLGVLQHAHLERGKEIARLRKENARMRLAIGERESAGPLTVDSPNNHAAGRLSRPVNAGNSAPNNDQPTPTNKTRSWPSRTYFNAGQETPIAALQTMAWACDQGDVAAMANLFIIDDAAIPKAEAVYTAIPVEMKAEWNSLEVFAAAMIVHDGIEQPYPGREVLALARIEPVTAGRVRLVLPRSVVSGVVYEQTTAGWKYVISEAVVDDYIARNHPAATEG